MIAAKIVKSVVVNDRESIHCVCIVKVPLGICGRRKINRIDELSQRGVFDHE